MYEVFTVLERWAFLTFFDDHPQMAFVERNQEIQTLPAKTATEAFAVGIRLRRPHWRAENPHAEPRDRLVQFPGKDAVPVVEHESILSFSETSS